MSNSVWKQRLRRGALCQSVGMASCLLAFSSAWADPDREIIQNWHQWRGPLATGTAPLGDPPTRWSETANVRWKVKVPGRGNSTPIVWNDHIFILAAVETSRVANGSERERLRQINEGQLTEPPRKYHRFAVMDFDRESGSLRWEKTVCVELPHEGRHHTNTYASASPVTDGQRVYAFFGSRGIYCFDLEGNSIWQRDLGDMRTRHGWGEGASPALHGETLLVNWDHEEDSFLYALDTESGETRWKIPRDEPTSWSTPLVVDRGRKTQVVVSATNKVRGYDVFSGEQLWECGGQATNVIASPVPAGEMVICMSWYGDSAVYAIPLDAQGDITDSGHIQWSYGRLAPYCPSPLLYDEHLYFTGANTSVFTCLKANTGESVHEISRLPAIEGEIYASPAAAAGRIYFTSRNGRTVVLQHGDALGVLSVNQLDDAIDASPAIAGRQIFLRGREYLYCLEDSVKQEPDR